MVLAPGQPIPHGRPYHNHLNGPVHMMTARKRVGPLIIEFIIEFIIKDFIGSFSDDLFDPSSDHSSPAPSAGMRPSHHLCLLVSRIPRSSVAITDRPSHDSFSMSPSRKRSRSPAASIPLSLLIPGALSYAHADLLPLPKRIRSSAYVTNLKDSLAERFEPSRDRRIDARVVVKAVDRDEIETGTRGPVKEGAVEVMYKMLGDMVQRFHVHTLKIPVHRVQAIEGIHRDQRHRIVATGHQSTDMLERIKELEELRVQRELRHIWRFRFYDRMRIARLEACARRHWATVLRLFLEYPSVDPVAPNSS
nr:hypothetical protein [Tanacetum cinerariifolium]